MLEDLQPPKQVRSCKVRTLKEGLAVKDQELLETYVSDTETWTPHKLAIALGRKGLKIDHRQITAHRDHVCSCGELQA